jgi:hypothetical protein
MLIAVRESKLLLESRKHSVVNKYLFLLTMTLWSDRTLKLATCLFRQQQTLTLQCNQHCKHCKDRINRGEPRRRRTAKTCPSLLTTSLVALRITSTTVFSHTSFASFMQSSQMFCHPDQCSLTGYVDDSSCWFG